MSGKSDTRDARAIAAIDCPRCLAKAGHQCNFPPIMGRPSCCNERRRANQERIAEQVGPLVTREQPVYSAEVLHAALRSILPFLEREAESRLASGTLGTYERDAVQARNIVRNALGIK